LLDPQGAVRGLIRLDEEDATVINLADQDGRILLTLSAGRRGSRALLKAQSGDGNIDMFSTVAPEGAHLAWLTLTEGEAYVWLSTMRESAAHRPHANFSAVGARGMTGVTIGDSADRSGPAVWSAP
jgi:hypothetical protein